MIEALMDSPFFGIECRGDVSPSVLNSWVTTRKCDLCGEEFTMYCDVERYCYRVNEKGNNHKMLIFCSWHCLRQFEREQAERIQTPQGSPRLSWRRSREAALERKAKCERKIKQYQDAALAGQTAYERQVARANVQNWKTRLKEVEGFLNGEEG